MLELRGRLDLVRVLQRSTSALKRLQPGPEDCGPLDLGGERNQVRLLTEIKLWMCLQTFDPGQS